MHVRAFVEENTGDASCDFGRNGGAPARGHVSGGVEQRLAARGAQSFPGQGYFYGRLRIQQCVNRCSRTGEDNQKPKENSEPFPRFAAFALAFVDAQRDSAPGLYVRPDTTLDWEPLWSGGVLQVSPGARPRALG